MHNKHINRLIKKSILFTCFLLIALYLTSCNLGNSPRTIAEKFLTATQQMKFDEAKKYCTPETGKMLDVVKNISMMIPDSVKDKVPEFYLVNEKIDNDAATLTYKEKTRKDIIDIRLRKIEGKWLVSMEEGTGGKDKAPPVQNDKTNKIMDVAPDSASDKKSM